MMRGGRCAEVGGARRGRRRRDRRSAIPGGEAIARQTLNGAARHRRRPLDPRHDRHRRAVFLLGLDPFDPSRHRRRPRRRPRACRRRDRLDLGGRGRRRCTACPRSALIDMGDFVGGMLKYLRRHPVRARHHRRRLRQDDQARRRACSTCIRGRGEVDLDGWLAGRSSEAGAAGDLRRAHRRSQHRARRPSAMPRGAGVALGDAVAARGLANGGRGAGRQRH